MRNSKGQFQLGHSGGRPKGARNRLAARVFEDILTHWCEPAAPGSNMSKGQEALETLYKEKPGEYLRLTASVLPERVPIRERRLRSRRRSDRRPAHGAAAADGRDARGVAARAAVAGGGELSLDIDSLPPEKVKAAIARLEAEKTRRIVENKLAHYRPYPKQAAFHAAGVSHRERLLIAANQSGKSAASGGAPR
jgi:hypothetical protein